MADPLNVGLIVERRYLAQTQPSGMIAALEERRQNLSLIDPQETFYRLGDDGWLDGLDILVARGRSYALLCLLEWAESLGKPTINRKAAIAAVHNKADMSVRLAAGNVKTPRTFFGSLECLAREIQAADYPVILKPIFGDNCRGLLVVASAEELAEVKWDEPVVLAQSYLPSDGYDLKLYGIGEEVWAVRKPSPFNKRDETSGPAEAGLQPLTPQLEALGRRCGELFGLELYGVDCIQSDDGPLVIEVNDYPNYTGVPGADAKLADYAINRAGGSRGV